MDLASTSSLLIVNAVLVAASLVASLTGFGYALVATPFLVLLFPPTAVVPMVLVSWFPMAVILIYQSRRLLNPRRIARMLAGAVVGGPLGIYGLASLSADDMRSVIGAITLLAVASLLVKPTNPWRRETPALLGAGLLSGILGGASAMSGPPIVLLGLKQRWEHEGFRADLLCYFFLLHAMVAAVLGNVGILAGDTLTATVLAFPGVLVGYVAGMWLRRHVDGRMYRRLAIGLIVTGGVLALGMR